MLASDGFWDVFDEKRAANLLKGVSSDEAASQKLCKKAKELRGFFGMGSDDITIVVASVGDFIIGATGCKCTVQ